jgi:hypothetical protein
MPATISIRTARAALGDLEQHWSRAAGGAASHPRTTLPVPCVRSPPCLPIPAGQGSRRSAVGKSAKHRKARVGRRKASGPERSAIRRWQTRPNRPQSWLSLEDRLRARPQSWPPPLSKQRLNQGVKRKEEARRQRAELPRKMARSRPQPAGSQGASASSRAGRGGRRVRPHQAPGGPAPRRRLSSSRRRSGRRQTRGLRPGGGRSAATASRSSAGSGPRSFCLRGHSRDVRRRCPRRRAPTTRSRQGPPGVYGTRRRSTRDPLARGTGRRIVWYSPRSVSRARSSTGSARSTMATNVGSRRESFERPYDLSRTRAPPGDAPGRDADGVGRLALRCRQCAK